MPKAADRFRAEPAPRATLGPRMPAFARALAPRSKRGVAGAALVAVMIGIVVNAVALQHGRRVDPAPDPAPVAVVAAPAPAPVRPPAPAPVAAPAPLRPSPSPVAVAHADRGDDPIAALLRGQGADKRKMTLAAQTSLARLGYPLKATGSLDGDTKSALAAFQKAHKLPLTNEITPKLVKSLSAAADE